MPLTLGRLVAVPLREIWAREDGEFTPWLAASDNLDLLSDTLGLGRLEVKGTEVPVGSFYIDILARDMEGDTVVIENQFGPTDHTHLGQIMTYVAGQEGRATVVWIAERFREEHRAAIDWLNASTIEDFNFFAVEVEALRIGNSIPAPRFNVIGKPNAWSRGVARTARETSKGLDERQRGYVAYWSAFGAFLQNRNSPFKVPVSTPRDYWCSFGPLGQSGFTLGATASFRDCKLGVEIYMGAGWSKRAFDRLEAEREGIDAEFGAPLEWQRMDDKKSCRVATYRTDLDPNNEQQWPDQHAWFAARLDAFARVFRPRIARLNVREVENAVAENGDPQ